MRTYYTLCLWNTDTKSWEDDFGSYRRAEVVEEVEFCGHVKAHCRILHTDGTAADMIAKRDALAPRK